ncbi:MAG TPA: UrcA family protein, partial [Steroidobacteraceae bacterium]
MTRESIPSSRVTARLSARDGSLLIGSWTSPARFLREIFGVPSCTARCLSACSSHRRNALRAAGAAENLFRQSEDRILKAKFPSSTRSVSLQIALGAIACGVSLMTAPAQAFQRDGEPLTKVVRFADLNLNGAAGVQTLYGRLRMAATQVCAPFRGTSLRERTKWRECFDPALARSVAA